MKILFKKGSHGLSSDDSAFLGSIATNIKSQRKFRVTIVGYLSNEDLLWNNGLLSKKRVNTVIKALIRFGVPTSWIGFEIWKSDSIKTNMVELIVSKS